MISEDTAKKLHDRFSRGEALSTKEQKQLEDWYARQDAAESRMLTAPSREKNITLLQKQVEAVGKRIAGLHAGAAILSPDFDVPLKYEF